MKVRQILEELGSWTGEQRLRLHAVMDNLCPLSLNELSKFQHQHGVDIESGKIKRDFEEFTKKQNKLIIECIKLEMSEIGVVVRKKLGMPSLTLDTEIDIEGPENAKLN